MKKKKSSAPIIRFRSLLAGISVISVLIAGPLLMVWKQVYITSRSKEIDKLSDSLTVLSEQMTKLNLRCRKMTSAERIERIARRSLALEYPSSSQIVVVNVPRRSKTMQMQWSRDLAAFIKRSIFGENG